MKNQKKYFRLFDNYVRKGEKARSKKHREYAMKFLAMCEIMGSADLQQIGKKHVIAYWKMNRNLTRDEALEHWRALCVLWELGHKIGYPALPLQCIDMDILSIPQ